MRNRRGRKRIRERRPRRTNPVKPGYPLTMALSDEYVRVVTITTDHAAESRLVSMGINPGALLHIISTSGSGPIVVARDETRFGIDRKTAWHVRVVPASSDYLHASYPLFCDDNCRGCSYRTEMMKAEYGESITLQMLKEGETGTVVSIRGRGVTVTRLRNIGITKGTEIRMVRNMQHPDSVIVELEGKQMEIAGWDALHVILEVNR
ncbi:MAG: ferrous iron transport protein A [Candidatus Aegiribacteria sp.]|nr:ferrous iron transport protein A [Candidatus Aegiribacteria sp.]